MREKTWILLEVLCTVVIIPSDVFHITSYRRLRLGEERA